MGQPPYGIDGVVWSLSVLGLVFSRFRGPLLWKRHQVGCFQQRWHESPFAYGAQHDHGITMKVGHNGLVLLVWRNVRRNEKDSAEIVALAGGTCQGHMAQVDGIESSTEEADVHMVLAC